MAARFDLFVCGTKGLKVVESICVSRFKDVVNRVVIGKDNNVQDDPAQQIESLCRLHEINFCSRPEYVEDPFDGYRFMIGWKWLSNQLTNTIVLHDSLLPAYRGFSPLVNALIAGETKIGATAFYATEKYDAGPVISQKTITIEHPIRISHAINQLGELYTEIVHELMERLLAGSPIDAKMQDESLATYSVWRDENDYFLNWAEDSDKILRSIYALGYPYPGARTFLDDEVIIITDALKMEDVNVINRDPGKVIFVDQGFPVVICGKGLLKITGAVDGKTNDSILPLKKFRSRFGKVSL